MKRRDFVKTSAAIGGALLPLQSFLARRALALTPQGAPLAGSAIPQFVDPLPGLQLIDGTAGTQVVLGMEEFQSLVMPSTFVPAAGAYTGTYVWGYRNGDSGGYPYIGPVILAKRDTPTEVKFVNNLGVAAPEAGVGSKIGAWVESTDQTLHWADPLNAHMTEMPLTNYYGPIPAVPHLHGCEVPPQLDGGPDAWFTSDGVYQGHAYYPGLGTVAGNGCVYRYPNSQEAANIWFHDHALGITRLNVYAGLAGGYLIRDDGLSLPTGLTAHGIGTETIVPLVIQDRMFDVNGQLFFPILGINPEHPFWIPEFVGDTIVVNGKVWPYKAVDRQRYRMLFLNGSSARAYDMSLIHRASGVRGPRMWVIGTDAGYLDAPVLIDPNSTNKAVAKSLTIMPGERYEVIVDFNDPVWQGLLTAAGVPFPLNLELRNTAKTPFPGGAPAAAATTGRIMQFRVQPCREPCGRTSLTSA